MEPRTTIPSLAGAGLPALPPPSIPRVYDYASGGKDNHATDRAVVEKMNQVADGINMREAARANLEFVPRGIEAAAQLGIRQFLVLGCGIPQDSVETTHETATRVHVGTPPKERPVVRVAYVDNDRAVGAAGRALLVEPDVTMMVEADARHVDMVIAHVRSLIRLKEPVGLVGTALAHFWRDEDDPGGILRRYRDAFTAGGLFVFSHARSDLLARDELEKLIAVYRKTAEIFPRSLNRIQELFLDGLHVLQPGLVEASTWRGTGPARDVGRAHFVAAVAAFGPFAKTLTEEP